MKDWQDSILRHYGFRRTPYTTAQGIETWCGTSPSRVPNYFHVDSKAPPPHPQVGQVWVELGEDGPEAQMILIVCDKGADAEPRYGYRFPTDIGGTRQNPTRERTAWPPAGAILVAGPGAPWIPAEDEK